MGQMKISIQKPSLNIGKFAENLLSFTFELFSELENFEVMH